MDVLSREELEEMAVEQATELIDLQQAIDDVVIAFRIGSENYQELEQRYYAHTQRDAQLKHRLRKALAQRAYLQWAATVEAIVILVLLSEVIWGW